MNPFIFHTNHSSFKKRISNSQRSPSSFKVPARLLELLNSKRKQYGSYSKYFHHLLDKYRLINYSGLTFGRSNGVKQKHQEPGQKLKAISFRPDDRDWLEIRMISQSRILTMTSIFLTLMEMDCSEAGDAIDERVLFGIDGSLFLQKPFIFVQIFDYNARKYKIYLRGGYLSKENHPILNFDFF
ncbi:MAG: DUF1564 domain-containing protein [Leptospira sp.]|nr:DUF1564 domain-containing protein [Leptospira sp.]